jgi:hypothetical protein
LIHLHENTIRQKDLTKNATAIKVIYFYGTIITFDIKILYVI